MHPSGTDLDPFAEIGDRGTKSIDQLLRLAIRCINGIGFALPRKLFLFGAFKTFSLGANLILKQIPFLPETRWSVLSENSQFSCSIGESMTDPGSDPVEGGANQGICGAHEPVS